MACSSLRFESFIVHREIVFFLLASLAKRDTEARLEGRSALVPHFLSVLLNVGPFAFVLPCLSRAVPPTVTSLGLARGCVSLSLSSSAALSRKCYLASEAGMVVHPCKVPWHLVLVPVVACVCIIVECFLPFYPPLN